MQRYKVRCHDCDPEIIPHEAGKWVRWGDVERLRAELAEAKKPDCLRCQRRGEFPTRCLLTNAVCVNGDAYYPFAPVRLYEKEGK